MTRPLLEVADIVRAEGDRFIYSNFRWIHWAHRKVLRAIARCRTAALDGYPPRTDTAIAGRIHSTRWFRGCITPGFFPSRFILGQKDSRCNQALTLTL
jgi:hypothetical protein